jgi:hypothetical protein
MRNNLSPSKRAVRHKGHIVFSFMLLTVTSILFRVIDILSKLYGAFKNGFRQISMYN